MTYIAYYTYYARTHASYMHASFRLVSFNNTLHFFTNGAPVIVLQRGLHAVCAENVFTLQSPRICHGIEADGAFG